MQHIPQPREIYKHFKGNYYQIITMAKHSETGEMLVIYQAMYGDYGIYARPVDMFLEKIDKKRYPQVEQEYRFEVDFSEREEEVSLNPAGKKMDKGSVPAESGEGMLDIDPMVLAFLDVDSYEERLNILTGLRHRITDDMINVMAIATDIEVKPGTVEERYEELRNCLLTFERFEGKRLR